MSIEVISFTEASAQPREPELPARRKNMQIEIGAISVQLCAAEEWHGRIISQLTSGESLGDAEETLRADLTVAQAVLRRLHEQYVDTIRSTSGVNWQIRSQGINKDLLVHELQPPVIDEPTVDLDALLALPE